MRSNYKRLGDFIREVNNRNTDLTVTNLLGINIDKFFMPSVANIVGTDMTRYKIVKKGQFACNRMHVGRDERLPVALSKDVHDFLVSPAYDVFEIIDTEKLLSEYLMMWFSRREFDRNAWFYTDADVRGGLNWKAFCEMELPIPDIAKQREIVKEYNVLVNRVALNNQLIQKLEETAQAIYKQRFVDVENEDWEIKVLDNLCSLITDGKHGDCKNELNSGYYFLSAKDLRDNTLVFDNARQITKKDFEETHRRTNLKPKDICMVNTGATIGRMSIAPDIDLTFNSTFQKSVAILKPKNNVTTSYYLYCLLKNQIKEIIDLASGTSQPNLLLSDLRNYNIRYPDYESILSFEKKICPIFEFQYCKIIENNYLNKLKELLLSKLTKVKS